MLNRNKKSIFPKKNLELGVTINSRLLLNGNNNFWGWCSGLMRFS